jgi:hypothetical protein
MNPYSSNKFATLMRWIWAQQLSNQPDGCGKLIINSIEGGME